MRSFVETTFIMRFGLIVFARDCLRVFENMNAIF